MRRLTHDLVLKTFPPAFALLATMLASCAPAVPAKSSLELTRGDNLRAEALWSRSITGGVSNANIYHGTVIFGIDSRPFGGVRTEALDLRTGRRLWEQMDAVPLSGSPLFLAVRTAVERIDALTGRVIWRSAPLCGKTSAGPKGADFQPPTVALPTYAAAIGSSLYIGCNGGKIFALHIASGRVFASAYPAYVDEYDQIVSLGHDTLGVGGEGGGAFLARRSAIVKADTLSTVVALGPDQRILGAGHGNVVVDDACCQGRHSDSWPADIQLVSLASGKIVFKAHLHPYRQPLPPSSDLPGPGLTIAVGDSLYTATHSGLFAYDLKNLERAPRVMYADLANLPTVIDRRYLSIQIGAPRDVRQIAVLDMYHGMRVIWTKNTTPPRVGEPHSRTRQQLLLFDGHAHAVIVDASCTISASSGIYTFMVCRNADIVSHAHLGSPPTFIGSGRNMMIPEAIAVYASHKR